MKIISGYRVFCLYITYKAHFNSNADISKYNYKAFNVSYEHFLSRNDIHFYDNLAKKIKYEKELIFLLIAVFLHDPQTWIGDIVNNYQYYLDLKEKREAIINNIEYYFRKDCFYLLEHGLKFKKGMENFVFNAFINSNIILETFIIFKKIFSLNLDNIPSCSYFYAGKYEKYEKLLKVDIEKYKKILKEVIIKCKEVNNQTKSTQKIINDNN